MFNKIYVEKDVFNHPRVQDILRSLNSQDPIEIEDFADWWGRAKKPYLQKRDQLNLFIAQKKGQKIKLAPDAYGLKGEPHYYFVHAYNCIYECQYCYLQGYFNTPDLVWFVNHEEIIQDMRTCLDQNANSNRVWFHAGEFSDSLALSHLTKELPVYHHFLESNTQAIMELRTKSVNIRELLKLKPLGNLITSFSLSAPDQAKSYDLKTPSLVLRLKAMQELAQNKYPIAAHFDPLIYHPKLLEELNALIGQMKDFNLLTNLEYISIGVVRFTKEVYREVQKNYPQSSLLQQNFIYPKDGKIRYPKILRQSLLLELKQLLISHGVLADKIYLCMEEE